MDGTGTGVNVEFTTVGGPAVPANAIQAQRAGTNAVFTFRGTPGATYRIQATTNLVQPPGGIEWMEAGSHTADANGEFELTVSTPSSPRRLFRTVYP